MRQRAHIHYNQLAMPIFTLTIDAKWMMMPAGRGRKTHVSSFGSWFCSCSCSCSGGVTSSVKSIQSGKVQGTYPTRSPAPLPLLTTLRHKWAESSLGPWSWTVYVCARSEELPVIANASPQARVIVIGGYTYEFLARPKQKRAQRSRKEHRKKLKEALKMPSKMGLMDKK